MTKKRKKVICFILFVILVFQISAINITASIYSEFANNQKGIEKYDSDIASVLINDTMRGQQKNTLSSLKQSWVKYLDSNKNNDLLKKDNNDLPIYIHGTDYVGYDADTMYKKKIDDFYLYNIYEKETNTLILEQSRPEWDCEKLEEILDVLVSPIKQFGNNGGLIVYDSNTGQVFLDTTPANRSNSIINASMFDDHKAIENKNPEETKIVLDKFFKNKKDSNRVSNIIYMFNEETKMGDEASNFVKYPLGDYDRQFIEMSILPYETIGFDGQPMQLTVLSVIDEQDSFSAYKEVTSENMQIVSNNKSLYEKASMVLIFSLVGTMLVMLITLYVVKYKFNSDDN